MRAVLTVKITVLTVIFTVLTVMSSTVVAEEFLTPPVQPVVVHRHRSMLQNRWGPTPSERRAAGEKPPLSRFERAKADRERIGVQRLAIAARKYDEYQMLLRSRSYLYTSPSPSSTGASSLLLTYPGFYGFQGGQSPMMGFPTYSPFFHSVPYPSSSSCGVNSPMFGGVYFR